VPLVQRLMRGATHPLPEMSLRSHELGATSLSFLTLICRQLSSSSTQAFQVFHPVTPQEKFGPCEANLFFSLSVSYRSRDSVVGIATGYGLEDQVVGV
jgi:hypothetical protein